MLVYRISEFLSLENNVKRIIHFKLILNPRQIKLIHVGFSPVLKNIGNQNEKVTHNAAVNRL